MPNWKKYRSPAAAARHRIHNRGVAAERRAQWSSVGACTICGTPDVAPFKRCLTCRKRLSRYMHRFTQWIWRKCIDCQTRTRFRRLGGSEGVCKGCCGRRARRVRLKQTA